MDPVSKRADMADANWVLKRSWLDKDVARAFLDKHGRVYDSAGNKKMKKHEIDNAVDTAESYMDPNKIDEPIFRQAETRLYADTDNKSHTYTSEDEKLRLSDSKVPFFYLYKRETIQDVPFFMWNGARVEYDRNNPAHRLLNPDITMLTAPKSLPGDICWR